jgi:hypothetical protein
MILSSRSKTSKIASCAFLTTTFSLVFSLLMAVPLGGFRAMQERPRFGIFMPKLDVYSRTPDVQQRVLAYLRTKPAKIPLADFPIISEDDLLSYDWDTHTLHLRDSIWQKIPRPGNGIGTPFAVVVDGTPIYVGAFWSGISSLGNTCPVIVSQYFGYDERDSKDLTIRLGFLGTPIQGLPDPRNNERLKKVLAELGKLKVK